MAKGWKHGSDHPERLLGSQRYRQDHTGGADLLDLREEDVWPSVAPDDVGNDAEGGGEESFHGGAYWGYSGGVRPGLDRDDRGGRTRRWPGGEEDRPPVGGLSLAFEDANGSPPGVIHQYSNVDSSASISRRHHLPHHHVPSSAPVNVPDRPKIRDDSSVSLEGRDWYGGNDDGEWVPPHEYLAREYVKSGRAVANSVFEGVGRTLKGRDMRRVRDAVWSQTGFFG